MGCEFHHWRDCTIRENHKPEVNPFHMSRLHSIFQCNKIVYTDSKCES